LTKRRLVLLLCTEKYCQLFRARETQQVEVNDH
jgi:hypothetical protein